MERFAALKTEIQESFPELKVENNKIPADYKVEFPVSTVLSAFNGSVFPRTGSFEVYFRGKLIFSKLKTRAWPNLDSVKSAIEKIMNEKKKNKDKKKMRSTNRLKPLFLPRSKLFTVRKKLNTCKSQRKSAYGNLSPKLSYEAQRDVLVNPLQKHSENVIEFQLKKDQEETKELCYQSSHGQLDFESSNSELMTTGKPVVEDNKVKVPLLFSVYGKEGSETLYLYVKQDQSLKESFHIQLTYT